MSGHDAAQRRDPVRKAVIVVALVAALIFLYRYAAPSDAIDPTGMLALGFVILAGYTLGELVGVIKLPHITGYILGGFVLGPSVAGRLPDALRVPPFHEGVLNHAVLGQLGPLSALALALIALTAGGELRLSSLREDFRAILGMLGGQLLIVVPATLAMIWAISGAFPAIALPILAERPEIEALALGGLLAAVTVSVSPSATIAIINGTGARGLMTRQVMSSVVFADVVVITAFSFAGAFAGEVLGTSVISQPLAIYLLVHIGGSLLIGGVVGGVIALWLKYVQTEHMLFLVALTYSASFLAGRFHLDALLVFIAAGFVTSNFSREGDTLIREVEKLSMPVYVVFFTLAGAEIDIDALLSLAPYAIALFLVRATSMFAGVSLGARIAGAPPGTARYGWTGFISQAGISIGLATLVSNTYGEAGRALGVLIISVLGLNEMIGPVLFKAGLGLAGDLPAGDPSPTTVPPTPREASPRAATPTDHADTWGAAPALAAPDLLGPASALRGALEDIREEVVDGPLAEWIAETRGWVRGLRREFLRYQRHVTQHDVPDLNRERSDLADRWRRMALDRAERPLLDGWSPARVVDAIDRAVAVLPARVEAPWEPVSYESPRDEGAVAAVLRVGLRAGRSMRGLFGQAPPPRVVPFADLARFHVSGGSPSDLEAFAGYLVHVEAALAARARALAESIRAAHAIDVDALEDAVMDVGVTVDALLEEVPARLDAALGAGLRRLQRDLPTAGTFDLPARSRRPSLTFTRRARALARLGGGFDAARAGVAASYAGLALELELIGFEARIAHVVEAHGAALARDLAGRGPLQLDRLAEALVTARTSAAAHLGAGAPAVSTIAAIRADAQPLARVAADASDGARQLRAALAEPQAVAPLLEALQAHAGQLADTSRALTRPLEAAPDAIPVPPATTTIPTRELVRAWIESSVATALVDRMREIDDDVAVLADVLADVERMVAFNVELVGAELDALGDEPVSRATSDLCAEMLLGALDRSLEQIAVVRASAGTWPDRCRAGVVEAVLDGVEGFSAQLLDGRVTELRLRLLRERAPGRLARDAQELRGGLRRMLGGLTSGIAHRVGRDRIDRARRLVGLRSTRLDTARDGAPFVAPRPSDAMPDAYRRLFSAQALDSGDTRNGRQEAIARARDTLGAGRTLRTVAVVGWAGTSERAVLQAIVRSLPGRVVRIAPEGPVTVADVEAWLADLRGDEVVVVEGLDRLFRTEPGGFAPLKRWAAGVLDTAHRTSWLVWCPTPVWTFAAAAAPLDDLFAEVVRLEPLDPAALREAVWSRHAMSGYAARFEPDRDPGRDPVDRVGTSARDERVWFDALHHASGGVPADALLGWTAAIRHVDGSAGVVTLGPVPRPPIDAIADLPEEARLTLVHALRQGWTSAELHAALFRREIGASRAHLARLVHEGLLVENGALRVAPHLVTAARRALALDADPTRWPVAEVVVTLPPDAAEARERLVEAALLAPWLAPGPAPVVLRDAGPPGTWRVRARLLDAAHAERFASAVRERVDEAFAAPSRPPG